MKTVIKLSLCFSLCLSTPDYAVAITTDIVPAAPTTITPAVHPSPGNYTISGGQPLGTDTLLETFTNFNLASPDTVTFANSAGYTNLIVRVTGGLSTIDGQMTSLITNLYFINPAGVTFGSNAVIDVPGAFHVSTADKMTVYQDLSTTPSSYLTYLIDTHSTTSVTPLPGSTLGITPPSSFGFLGNNNNSSVTVTGSSVGSMLSVKPGQTFDIVANNINIGSSTTKANLEAPSGEIRLVGFKGTGEVSVNASTLPDQNLLATNGGDITIINGSKVTSEGGHAGLWGGNIDIINNGGVSANSTDTSPGSVTVRGGTINITNTGSITTSTSSTSKNIPAGDVDVKASTLNIIGDSSTTLTGISSSAVYYTPPSDSTGKGGTVTVTSDILNIQNGGAIRTATFTNSDAGNTTVTANVLTIDGKGNASTATGITSRANKDTKDSTAIDNTGDAGTVLVNAGSLTILNGGQISTDTFTVGNAGTVTVNANSVAVDGFAVNKTTGVVNPSKISSGTRSGSKGYAGDVSVTASESIQLTNGGNIGIQSLVTNHTGAIEPTTKSAITITAPDISLTNSKITSEAKGIDNAGDINVNFSHWLTLNSSFITTAAKDGNGGIITINGGEAIYLENSGFLTSVSGAKNGGNINVNADALIMNTAVIQANAVGGSGGDINIALKSLIPSQNRLILGGKKVLWQPNIPGFNVIQAASESGVSGTVNVNSPQFDISGSVSGLDTSGLVLPSIAQNPCASQGTRSSSLARGSKGGIPVSESKAGFIPAAGALPADTKAKTGAAKDLSDAALLPPTSVIAQNKSTCAPI